MISPSVFMTIFFNVVFIRGTREKVRVDGNRVLKSMEFDRQQRHQSKVQQPSAYIPPVRRRPHSALSSSSGGLLRRRSSTPNTTKDIVKLFHAKSTDPLAGSPCPISTKGKPQRDSPDVPRESSNSLFQQECASHRVQPQTVAFLDLLAAGRLLKGSEMSLPFQERLPRDAKSASTNRPSSAPITSVHNNRQVLWEPMLLTPHQETRVVHQGRPMSAQARSRIRPMSGVRTQQRPQSAQGATFGASSLNPEQRQRSSQKKISTMNHCGSAHISVDFFAHIRLRSCHFTEAMFDHPDKLHDLVSLVEALCAFCVHRDAAAEHVAQRYAPKLRVASVMQEAMALKTRFFPLSWTSPWSQVKCLCRISRESLVLHVGSPSSRLVGSRIFDDIVRMLNALGTGQAPDGYPSTPMLEDIAANRIVTEAVVSLSDEDDDMLLHEALRVDNEEEMEIVLGAATNVALGETQMQVSRSVSPSNSSPIVPPQGYTTNDNAFDNDTVVSESPHSTTRHPTSTVLAGGVGEVNLSCTNTDSGDPSASPKREQSSSSILGLRSFRSMRRLPRGAPVVHCGPLDEPFSPTCSSDPQADASPQSRLWCNPQPERISMFKKDSMSIGEATAMLRRLSLDNSDDAPSQPQLARKASETRWGDAFASFRKVRSLGRFNSALSPAKGCRKKIALVVVASTFRDASIPFCRMARGDAAKLVHALRTDCCFDHVALVASESPEDPDLVPVMSGIRRVVQRIVQSFVADAPVEPMIMVFVFGRGAVVPVGSIPGINPQSNSLVPYPSIAYASSSSAAKQPSPGVKVALLESAILSDLKSTDVVTPEMFQDLFQWNGVICKPAAVFFDIREAPVGPRFSRYSDDSSECRTSGFCCWYVPQHPPSTFVSVYKSGSTGGGIGSYYLLKILRGGILNAACKEFCPSVFSNAKDDLGTQSMCLSPSIPAASSPITIPFHIARHVQSGLAVYPSDVHHYLVQRLMRRNCNTLFALDLHVKGIDGADSATVAGRKRNFGERHGGTNEPHLFNLPSLAKGNTGIASLEQPMQLLFHLAQEMQHTKSLARLSSHNLHSHLTLAVELPLWRRSANPRGAAPTFRQCEATFRCTFQHALRRVFQGKPAVVASLLERSWVESVDLSPLDFKMTVVLCEDLSSSRRGDAKMASSFLQEYASAFQSAIAPRSRNDDPEYLCVEVEATNALCAPSIVVAPQFAYHLTSGGEGIACWVDEVMRNLYGPNDHFSLDMVDLVTVSANVLLSVPTRMAKSLDKALRLGVLRHVVGIDAFLHETAR